MQAAVGRRREALADMSGVEMTRYPPGLISALEKLQRRQHRRRRPQPGHRPPVDRGAGAPERRARAGSAFLNRLNRMFATHPPLEERIAALREL